MSCQLLLGSFCSHPSLAFEWPNLDDPLAQSKYTFSYLYEDSWTFFLFL